MKIILSETLSYCSGVRKTLKLANRLLADRPDRIYFMLGEIVHNERVIEDLKSKGLHFVDSLESVPSDGVIILQSHGVPLARYHELDRRGLEYSDTTCPMVKVIHRKIQKVEAKSYVPVVIGQADHEEVKGIVGQVGRAIVVETPDEVTPELFRGVTRAGVVVQSTFIKEEALRVLVRIREIVPEVEFYDTICQPTKTRQREVEIHSRTADCIIVIGSKRSANTMHLFQIARKNNPCTHLIDSPEGVDAIEIPVGATVFIASGASTPEDLIMEVVRRLEANEKGGAKAPNKLPIRGKSAMIKKRKRHG